MCVRVRACVCVRVCLFDDIPPMWVKLVLQVNSCTEFLRDWCSKVFPSNMLILDKFKFFHKELEHPRILLPAESVGPGYRMVGYAALLELTIYQRSNPIYNQTAYFFARLSFIWQL